MRLNKRLLVSGRPVSLATDLVNLALSTVGSGTFEVLEELRPARKPLVEFYAGVAGKEEYLVLTGALMELKPLTVGRVRVTVRELCTVLDTPIILNLFNATPRQVIARIERHTGLRFLLPAGADYLDERRANFVHYGSATEAMNLLATRWELAEAVWFQLPDGQMYWGHWGASPYTRSSVPIEGSLISSLDATKHELWLPYIPALRPGMAVEVRNPGAGQPPRFRIDALGFTGERVKVTWRAL